MNFDQPKYFFLLCFLLLFPFSIALGQSSLEKGIEKTIENWSYFHNQRDYDKAIEQANQAFELAKKLDDKEGMAIALNRVGLSLVSKKKKSRKNLKLAKQQFKQSLFYLATISNPNLRISNLEQLKWIAEREKNQQELALYEKQISEVKGLITTIAEKEALKGKVGKLAVQKEQLKERVKSLTEAQLESELLIALQKNQVDSLRFEGFKDSMLIQQKELELKEKSAQLALQGSQLNLQESEIKLQNSQRNFFLALAGIVGVLAIGTFLRYIETKKLNTLLATKNEIIEAEQKKSDQLLLNILPFTVATELKANGVAKARKYEVATVLFSDFKNFSAIAESLSPEKLVGELDFYFKIYDEIIGKYNLEKIKTIGDAYMCVGGVPNEKAGHSKDVVKAALEIQSYLNAWKLEREAKGAPFFEARMGIHTGPLIAGVVGTKKFAYDIWGDTVNIAARLESNSEAGKVNISASTYENIKNDFHCEYRGKIPVKNRGEIEMYFVDGLG